jgi:hypothetical protein
MAASKMAEMNLNIRQLRGNINDAARAHQKSEFELFDSHFR